MKPTPARRVFRGSLLVTLAVTWTCTAAPIPRNGGFEQGTTGWKASFGGTLHDLLVETDRAFGGSKCVHIRVENAVKGVDSPPLRIGRDLHRRGRYRVSAMIRNRGIKRGDFGLRLYFYGGEGEFVAMKGGIHVNPDTPIHDWRRYATEFGYGTPTPFPAGAATAMVRFSIWGPDSSAAGEVWLDDVAVEVIEEGRPAARRDERVALVWSPPASPPAANALDSILSETGFTVRRATTDELTQENLLTTAHTDLLVLPTDNHYPLPLVGKLETYLQEGGGLMTVGHSPLSVPLWRTAKGWVPIHAVDPASPSVPISLRWKWLTKHHGADESIAMVEDPGCGYARVAARDLKGYAYIGTKIPVLAADPAVLCFEVRGDGRTERLCIEIEAKDGSRWKALVPMDKTWRSHRLHLAQLVSYASEGRGMEGDACAATEAEVLLFGFTSAMVGKGDHRFDLRNVEFRGGVVPAADLSRAKWYAQPGLEPSRWFGKLARCPRRLPSPLGLACRTPMQADVLIHPAGTDAGGSAGQSGAWQVSPCNPVAPLTESGKPRRPSLRESLREAGGSSAITLLQARGGDVGTDPVTIGTLALNRTGRFCGSWFAVFGLDVSRVAGNEVVRDAVARASRLIHRGLWIDPPAVTFRAEGEEVLMDVSVRARNTSAEPCALPVETRVRFGSQTPWKTHTADVRIPSWQTVPLATPVVQGIRVPADACKALQVHVALPREKASPAFMPVASLTFDARKALRRLCDFMVAEAEDDGKLHGFSFIDNRGMRTLLAGYELLGDRRYLDAALRWGRLMIAEQREDGGYRMGYGITSRGEACYVADGGEIAVGMARLVTYTEGAERDRFLDSLDAYMRYRESFRVKTGGIGVGWCLQDYGKRPIPRLDKPTRIFAPEKNTYTIGCTLAAAYAHARLRQSDSLAARAAGDADWLIERAGSLNGAFIESYMFAHCFTTDPSRRTLYETFIRRAFTNRVTDPNAGSWWLGGAGRSALNLDGLVYVYDRVHPLPTVRAEILEAMCAMFGEESPESMLRLTDGTALGHGEWIYLCFGGLGLADAIQPMVTMDNFIPQRPAAE